MFRQRLRLQRKRKRWVARSESRSDYPGRVFDGETRSPILQLQHTLGNQRVAQLIQAKRLTPNGEIVGLRRKLSGGADNPYKRSPANLKRTAHELAHVVQQTGGVPVQTKKREGKVAPLSLDELSIRPIPTPSTDGREEKKSARKPPVTSSAGEHGVTTQMGIEAATSERTAWRAEPAAAGTIQRNGSKSEAETPTSSNANRVAFVREEGLNLRENPDQKSKSLGTLKVGQRVHALEDPTPQPSWQKVAVLGRTGYVFAPRIHFPPENLIQKDPALRLIKVRSGLSFWALVKEMYDIEGNESTKDQNMNHFINAIRAVNK